MHSLIFAKENFTGLSLTEDAFGHCGSVFRFNKQLSRYNDSRQLPPRQFLTQITHITANNAFKLKR